MKHITAAERDTALLPDSFDSLHPEEWTLLLQLFDRLHQAQGGVTLKDVRLQMAHFMLRRRGVRPRRGERERYLLLVAQVASTLEWMVACDPVSLRPVLPIDTTRQLLPSWGKLHGPASHAEDLTFQEFHCALTALHTYLQTGSRQALLALCAVLYRPSVVSHGTLLRQPFSPSAMERLMKEARRIPPYVQVGVALWFAHLCSHIRTGSFVIGGSTVSFAPLFTQQPDDDGEPEGGSLGLNGILLSVAGSGVFGDTDGVNRTPLLQVLLKLLSDKQQADRLRRLSEHTKNNNQK